MCSGSSTVVPDAAPLIQDDQAHLDNQDDQDNQDYQVHQEDLDGQHCPDDLDDLDDQVDLGSKLTVGMSQVVASGGPGCSGHTWVFDCV